MNILTSLKKLACAWQPNGFRRLATGIVSALAVCSATSVLGQTNVANVVTLAGGLPYSQDVGPTVGSWVFTFTGDSGGSLQNGIKLDVPLGMAVDGNGFLYIAESAQGNLLKVTNPGNRDTSFTYLFASGFQKPVAVAVNLANNDVFVLTETDGLIWRYTSEGVLVGGGAVNAGTPLTLPSALTIDGAGNLFVTQQNGAVLRVTQAGVVTPIVPAATFSGPSGIAAYQTNVVAISDTGNNAIKLLNVVDFSITTLAGSPGAGFTNGPGAGAKFNMPRNIVLAPNGSLIVADQSNHRVRVVTAEGTVETLYGVSSNKWPESIFYPEYPGWLDGTNAHANQPWGVTIAPSGTNIFITEIGHTYDLLRTVGNLSFAAATGGGSGGSGVGNVSLTGNLLTFGFASGEGSASFLAKAGQTYYVPVTLTLPPAQQLYSLGFSLAATNVPASGAPGLPIGSLSFGTMLVKPVPGISGGTVYEKIVPGAWIGVYSNRVRIDTTTGTPITNLVPIITNTVFSSTVQNLLGVSWLEIPGETNLYNTVSQDLITYSLPYYTIIQAHSSGKSVLGAFGFTIPAGAPVGSKYRVQVLNGSGSSNLNGGVSIVTPVSGSLTNGPINSIKEITVVPSIRYLVGDLEEFRWINAGEFGDGKVSIIDAQETFFTAVYRFNEPTPGSDLFGAMDSYDAATLVDPSTGNIDTVLTGDGAITIGDLQVTLRRALDPFVGWVTREAGGTAPLLVPSGLDQPTFGLSSVNSTVGLMSASDLSTLKIVAGQVQTAGPGQVSIPIKAIVTGNTPIKSLMIALEVEAIGNSPKLQQPLQFQQVATTLGAPRFSANQGNIFGAAWMNTLNPTTPFGVPGLSAGEHVVGNLLVTIPAGVTDYSAYVIRVAHVSAIGVKRTASANGLVTFSDRSGSSIGDAIPDSWRLRYFDGDLNLLAAANADADGDGIPNWAEYRAGTDPNDRNSGLRAAAQTGAGTTISWPSELGLNYVLEYSTTLSSGNWTQLGGIRVGTGGDLTATDSTVSEHGRFYRVRLVSGSPSQ